MSDEGASHGELLLEAARRNNTTLLREIFASQASAAQITQLLNTTTDGVGEYCLHLAATYGSYHVLDLLLDQEGLEVDPIDRLEAETPLHKAVRFINGVDESERKTASILVELLLEAGADPRIRNKAKLRAFELVDPHNSSLRKILQKAEFAVNAGNDVIISDEDVATGSASDSD